MTQKRASRRFGIRVMLVSVLLGLVTPSSPVVAGVWPSVEGVSFPSGRGPLPGSFLFQEKPLLPYHAGRPELLGSDAPPRPYEPGEFPEWAHHLRRGEIVAIGSFPLAVIVSGIGLQLGRFAVKSLEEGQFSREYAPFFFSSRSGSQYNQDERVGLLISAGIISVAVAVADYILGRREGRVAAEKGDENNR